MANMTGSIIDMGKFSDLTISCRNRSWRVHRAIIHAQSTILADMIDSTPWDSTMCHIDLAHSDPEIIEKMLCFMYSGDYDDNRFSTPQKDRESYSTTEFGYEIMSQSYTRKSRKQRHRTAGLATEKYEDILIYEDEEEEEEEGENKQEAGFFDEEDARLSEESLLTNVKVYFMADLYGVWPLTDLATRKYAYLAEILWNTDSFVRSAADIYHLRWNKEDHEILRDRELRAVVADISAQRMEFLSEKLDFMAVLADIGPLAVDTLSRMIEITAAVDYDDSMSETLSEGDSMPETDADIELMSSTRAERNCSSPISLCSDDGVGC